MIEKWIEDNNLHVTWALSNKIFTIDNQAYLCLDHKSGKIFNADFTLIFNEEDLYLFENSQTPISYFVFAFGGKVYYSDAASDKVQLKLLQHIGRANDKWGFRYLGIHGGYELCSGSRTYKDWCKKAKWLGIDALGLTEKHTLAGAIEFQGACKKAGIKSIIGETVTVRGADGDYRVKLYVADTKGWRNLLRIHRRLNVDNESKFVEEDVLLKNTAGLYLVFCADTVLDLDKASAFINLYDFKGVFYQYDPVEYKSAARDLHCMECLKNYLKTFSSMLPLALICDAYYLEREDNRARNILSFISPDGGSTVFHSDNQHFKTLDEVASQSCTLFAKLGEDVAYAIMENAIKGTDVIVAGCDFKIPLGQIHLPKYEMTPEESLMFRSNEDLFMGIIEKGLNEIVADGKDLATYVKRVETELEVIMAGNFIDYFLIIRDIINWAEGQGIMVGTGRGSISGSILAYFCNLTKVDAIEYGLIFERFLNMARVGKGLPDADTDVMGERRDDIKRYMELRFGVHNVASIGTYNALQLKAAFKDLLRFHGETPANMNFYGGFIEESGEDLAVLFHEAARAEKLKVYLNEQFNAVNDISLIIGQPKSASVHASGIILAPKVDDEGNPMEIYDWMPCKIMKGNLITEWEGIPLDDAGFLKADLLGLKQLDKLQAVLNLIKENGGNQINLNRIDKKNEATYDLFRKGWNQDVFQFGTDGLSAYCREVKPDNIEELAAISALYRPGAMDSGAHTDYVKIKHGKKQAEYDWGCEEITKQTYGLLCLDGNSLISTPRGERRIKDIVPGEWVLTEDGSWNRVLRQAHNGQKATVKIRCDIGRELTLTSDHKVLTSEGWVEAGELTKMHIIKSYFIDTPFQEGEGGLRDWFLGLFLADGGSHNTVSIYCSSKQNAQTIMELGEAAFPDMRGLKLRERHNGANGYCWCVEFCQTTGVKADGGNDFNQLLHKYNLYKKTGQDKFWPSVYSIDTIAGFLEGDGCMENGLVRLANKQLAEGLFLALQNYNIRSAYYQEGERVFVVRFKDIDRKLPLRFKKIPDNRAVAFIVPRSYLPILKSDHVRYSNHSKQNVRKRLPFVNANIVLECGGLIKHDLWAKVLEVTEAGESDVYDLSVEHNHSFVAGGLVVHNCYQEQAIFIVQKVGGLSLTEGDGVRKATGKKDLEKMKSYKERFVNGAIDRGCSEFEANKIWDKIEVFAGYSFNLSHAVAYSLIGYQTQWLKAHYPLEFWTISLQFAKDEEVAKRISELNKFSGIKLYPPDINKSGAKFYTDFATNSIYWSLEKISHVADKAIEKITEERNKNGQFFSLEEFVKRIKGKEVNSRVVKHLILSGCFDQIHGVDQLQQRLLLMEEFCKLYDLDMPEEFVGHKLYDQFFWYKMQRELSGYGTFDYTRKLDTLGYTPEQYIAPEDMQLSDNEGYIGNVCGILTETVKRKTKKGEMCKLTLDCNNDLIDVVLWNDQWVHARKEIEANIGSGIVVSGEVKFDGYNKKNVLYCNSETEIKIF